MKLYLAGNVGILSREKDYSKLIQSRLLSYYEISQNLFASDLSFNFIVKRNEHILSRSTRRRLSRSM